MSPLAEPFPDLAPRERGDCAIGFLASRKGVAERALVGHGARASAGSSTTAARPGTAPACCSTSPGRSCSTASPSTRALIAQRDVALGMFFLPFDGPRRRRCVETVEDLAVARRRRRAGLGRRAVQRRGAAAPARRRGAPRPVVRQALFRRPAGLERRRLVRLPLPAAPRARRGALRAVARRVRGLEPLQPHRRLPRPRRALAHRRALPRPARRALRLALRPVPQPLLDQHHHRLAPRPAVLGRSPTTARSPPSAATSPGCTPSAATWSRRIVERHPRLQPPRRRASARSSARAAPTAPTSTTC